MGEVTIVSAPIGGKDVSMSFETGKLALQADGAVVGRVGDTMVLATATASSKSREGADFFPLTVDIEEKMYAAGKIPGSFFRREGRATDQAILTARLTDRPLRPCFPDGFRNDVHIVATVLGVDLANPHDVLAINAASAALMLSGIPFAGPVGAVRIAWANSGEWLPHPTYEEGDASCFEMVVAGRQATGGDVAIMMVEAGGTEATFDNYEAGTPRVTEEVIASGLEVAKRWIQESIDLQLELVRKAGAKVALAYEPAKDYADEVMAAVEGGFGAKLASALAIAEKADRNTAVDEVTVEAVAALQERFPEREAEIKAALRSLSKSLIRRRIVGEGIRVDGRKVTDIRPLHIEVGLIPTAHGSGLFQRGETQVLNVTTLGMPRMNQLLDTIGIDESKRYMHHYNMPPYATGEAGFMRGPKRREIGHGLLAERALLPVVPGEAVFPYTLRLVSEAVSSNGSTSMASVCGSTLSLMDAGVPIRASVAGVAMGLVHDGEAFVTLTDILGMEDAFGDMDFKVAGTRDSVTALQLDTKIDGLPSDVLAQALGQARDARLYILDAMDAVIAEPRADVNANAPKIVSFEIPADKVGEVIGPKGKVINTLQADTGTDIAVDDSTGTAIVTIGAKDGEAVAEARRRVMLIVDPPKPEVGVVYDGTVAGITKFGAFVNILPGTDGLLHISRIGRGRRVERVEDVFSMGDSVKVKVESVDGDGRVSLVYPEEDGDDGGRGGGGGRSGAGPGRERSRDDRSGEVGAGGRGGEERGAGDDSPGAAGGMVSFEDEFDGQLAAEMGDLGPSSAGGAPTRSQGSGRREGSGEGYGRGGRRHRDRGRR